MNVSLRYLGSYDHRLKEPVRTSGDLPVAVEPRIPRSTAMGRKTVPILALDVESTAQAPSQSCHPTHRERDIVKRYGLLSTRLTPYLFGVRFSLLRAGRLHLKPGVTWLKVTRRRKPVRRNWCWGYPSGSLPPSVDSSSSASVLSSFTSGLYLYLCYIVCHQRLLG